MRDEDGLPALIGRCIDGDLDRAERLDLFRQLALVPDARSLIDDAARVDLAAQDLARLAWSRPFRTALAAQALAAGILGLMLGAGAMALAMPPAPDAGPHARLHVLDLPFREAADLAFWHHALRIGPGHTVHLRIDRSHDGTILLRAMGEGAFVLALSQRRAGLADVEHRIQSDHVHYASLPRPRSGDLLVLRNDGAGFVQVHLSTPVEGVVSLHPQAASAWIPLPEGLHPCRAASTA